MKLLLFIIALVALSAGGQNLTLSDGAFVGSLGPAVAGSASCPSDGSPDVTSDGASTQIITDSDAYRFHGAFYTPAATKQLCKVGFKLKTGAGDVSAKTYTAYVYSLSGTTLDTVLATSSAVAGTAIPGTAGTVIFTFSGNPTLTGGTQYAIVVSSGETDAVNYILGYYGTGSVAESEYGLWRSIFTSSYAPGGSIDCAFSLYWYD